MNRRSGLLALACVVLACGKTGPARWPDPAACPAERGRSEVAPRSWQSAEVLLIAAGRPCSDEDDLHEGIRRDMATVESHLRALGFDTITRLDDPDAATLLKWLARPITRPLLVLHAGHGFVHKSPAAPAPRSPSGVQVTPICSEMGPGCTSTLCVSKQFLDVDALVASVATSRQFAVLIVDACSSAHVDVRRATTAVSVLSATPISLTTNVSGRTFIAETLSKLQLTEADTDCDGSLTDVELYHWLDRELPRSTGTSPQPKLRRQTDTPWFTLLRSEGRSQCATTSHSRDVGEEPVVFNRRPPRHVRMTGCVRPRGEGKVPWDDRVEPLARLVPMPCTAGVGQCFRLGDP